jgi:isocitrate/isopropylmalate dehydrogenase
MDAMARVLAAQDVRTRDLGGNSRTDEVTEAVIGALNDLRTPRPQ